MDLDQSISYNVLLSVDKRDVSSRHVLTFLRWRAADPFFPSPTAVTRIRSPPPRTVESIVPYPILVHVAVAVLVTICCRYVFNESNKQTIIIIN